MIARMDLRVRERDCPVQVGRHDHIVEATVIGTAIARFSGAQPRQAGPALAVMSLDPQRRQAARIRILRQPAALAAVGAELGDDLLVPPALVLLGHEVRCAPASRNRALRRNTGRGPGGTPARRDRRA